MEKWDRRALINFWEKWYFPANAVLYIVGDLRRSIEDVQALIQSAFGGVPPGREKLPGATGTPLTNGTNGPGPVQLDSRATSSSRNGSSAAEPHEGELGPLKRKHEVISCCLSIAHASTQWLP